MPHPMTVLFYLTLFLTGACVVLAGVFLGLSFFQTTTMPFYINGSIVGLEDCVETCMFTSGCFYSGNVTVSFVWNQQQLTQNVAPNYDCGYDCCADLVNTSVFLWVLLPLTSEDSSALDNPVVYYFSVDTPIAQPSRGWNDWNNNAMACFFLALFLGFISYVFHKKRPVATTNSYINLS